MNKVSAAHALETARARFAEIVAEQGLLDADVAVSVSALTAEQAIGRPARRDYPIVEGKEHLVEAAVDGAKGHAFTDAPHDFSGTLRDVMTLPFSSSRNRAVFVAVLNAALRSLGMLDAAMHCRDDDPEECARELADHVHAKWGKTTVGLIGLNPAIADALVGVFGPENVRMTDLNQENVGAVMFGVTIWNGRSQTEELIRRSRVLIVTGTTLVNGTFDSIWNQIQKHGKDYLIFGVTAAGVCRLMDWARICPYCRSE